MNLGYMNRRVTDAIKGIMLVFMFVHHFFTFPSWYVNGISYPYLETFAEYFGQPFRICVPVFAFLTGYFYFFASKKDLRYSFGKIKDVYLHYWAVYTPFLIFSLITGCFSFSLSGVFLELVGLKQPIMCFCWYVIFYASTMLILPILTKIGRTFFCDTISLLIIPLVVCAFLLSFLKNEHIVNCLNLVVAWFPCVAIGYVCSKYNLFLGLDRIIGGFRYKFVTYILCLVIVLGCFVSRYISFSIVLGGLRVLGNDNALVITGDVIRAPLFVYGCAKLLDLISKSRFLTPLEAIGKKSLLMWFLHCIFFNCCKEITQPIVYFPRNPLLVLAFGLSLCYIIAMVIEQIFACVKKYGLKYKR